MRSVLISGGLSLVLALFGTPLFIRYLVRKQYGQFIRQDGPTTHITKRGTRHKAESTFIGAWIPVELMERIDLFVEQEDLDRSKLLRRAIEEKIHPQTPKQEAA